jgi:hypothetical protein
MPAAQSAESDVLLLTCPRGGARAARAVPPRSSLRAAAGRAAPTSCAPCRAAMLA